MTVLTSSIIQSPFFIFHSSYIYTDSLPVNLKETVAREVLEQAKLHPKLQHLSKLCSVYLEKYALKTSKMSNVCTNGDF